jgi:hypothetical protein
MRRITALVPELWKPHHYECLALVVQHHKEIGRMGQLLRGGYQIRVNLTA